MAKLSTPKGKLVRKLGVNIFGNPKFDRLLSKKGYRPGQHGKAGNKKLNSLMVCSRNNSEIILKKLLK